MKVSFQVSLEPDVVSRTGVDTLEVFPVVGVKWALIVGNVVVLIGTTAEEWVLDAYR